ncbi:unnamed protein product [Effrenium voratum]|nr:unnamed protein product [Effrenium voratum]
MPPKREGKAKAGPGAKARARSARAASPEPKVEPKDATPRSKREPAKERVPTWRNKTVQGLFCDPYIGATSLEGGKPSQASDVVEMGAKLLASRATWPLPLADSEVDAFRESLQLLKEAHDRGQEGQAAFASPEGGMKWCQRTLKEITALEVGKRWLSEGGWRGENGGHAIMYMIQKKSKREVSFTVLNTGAGIHSFHSCDVQSLQLGKVRYQTGLCLSPVQMDCLNLAFLYTLFRMYYVRHRTHNSFQLYEVLLPTLKSSDVSHSGACFTTPQRAGTCYAKCVFLGLRTLLAELGVSSSGRRRCMLNYRICFLERIAQELDEASQPSLTNSDRITLSVALKQVARRCVRDPEAASAQTRTHACMQRIQGAVRLKIQDPSLDRALCADALQHQNLRLQGAEFRGLQGFQLLAFRSLVPPDVRNAFAGPSASKVLNPHVDLTGLASARAVAGGPTLEFLPQALLMCDRLEEVQCSRASKHLIIGVVETLVFEARDLWDLVSSETSESSESSESSGPSLSLGRGRELLGAAHRLGAHYVAAVRSVGGGRSTGAHAVLVLAALLELFEDLLRATPGLELNQLLNEEPKAEETRGTRGARGARGARGRAKGVWWSLRPWEKPDGPALSFAELTAWLPMPSPAACEVRSRICRRHENDKQSLWAGAHDTSALLVGPPESEERSEATGVSKNLLDFSRRLRRLCPGKPSLPDVDRPYQDWEVDLSAAFDEQVDAKCPEWAQARDLALFYQMLLASLPSLPNSLAGGAVPPADHVLMAREAAELSFKFGLFNPPEKVIVHVEHVCSLPPRRVNKLYPHASLTHPKLLCQDMSYLRFGGAMENELLSLKRLPDFDSSLTQAQAESLLSILSCPGIRIPLLLQFVVPNHIALMHHRQFQRIFFACLFEPGLFDTSKPSLDAKVPSQEPMGTEFGWLSEELATSPQLVLPLLSQLFEAMKDLGNGDCDGPLVQPFLFVVHVALLVQDFIEQAKSEKSERSARECLEEHARLFRRFTQKFARKVIARWIGQANSAKSYDRLMQCHAHLAMTAWPVAALEDGDVQSLGVAACTFSLWSEKLGDANSVEYAGDQADVIHRVFATLSRQRVPLLKAVENAEEQERNKFFSFILAGAIGTDRLPELSWRATEQMPKVCIRVVETSHPICKADFSSRKVCLPKAARIIVRFDPLSQLESGDFLKVYAGQKKDASKVVWMAGRSDVAKNGWPGVDAPGLVINSECFLVIMERLMHVRATEEEVAYGYRLIAEAEMPSSAVTSMQKQLSTASAFVCASILSEVGGDVQEAVEQYGQKDVRQKWEELETLSEARKSSLGLRVGGCFSAQAHDLQDAWLTGARVDLGMANISFEARETLQPMPADCFEEPDYREALGAERPNVLPISNSLYAKKFSFRCHSLEYTAEMWAAPEFTLALEYQGGIKLGKGDAVPFVFHPSRSGSGGSGSGSFVRWREQQWTELALADVPGHLRSHGAGAEVLAALLSTPPADPTLLNEPEPHFARFGDWWKQARWYGRASGAAGSVLLCEAGSGASARWLEFEAEPGGALVAFQIQEHGRCAAREAVWTSDARRSLLGCDVEGRFEVFAVPAPLQRQAGDLRPGAYGRSLVLTSAAGTHVPQRFLRGLLPEVLLPHFCFWQVSEDLINGRPQHRNSRWFGYSLQLQIADGRARVLRLALETEVLHELQDATRPSSPLFKLGEFMSTVEPLSHVLFWSKHGEDGEQMASPLELVEMPRLQLRFRVREGPVLDGKVVFQPKLYCDAYGGQFFVDPTPFHLLLPNCPHALPPHCFLLRAEAGDAKVVAPLGEVRRHRSYQEPFETAVYLKVFGETFFTPTAVYDLALSTGTDLKCPSLLSAIWLLLCRLLQRDYEGAVKLVPMVASADGQLRHDEQLAFRMALEDTSDRAPDAVAVRLRLVHAALRTQNINMDLARSAFADAASYISHLAHVSQGCSLSLAEEMELWSSLLNMRSDMESANRFIEWRRDLLTARKQGLSTATLQWHRRDPGAWIHTVLDDEEKMAFQSSRVSDIDCIGIKNEPLFEADLPPEKLWVELLDVVQGSNMKDGVFSTLLHMWERNHAPQMQRLATRILLFSVARDHKSLERRLVLVLCLLQSSPSKSLEPPKLKDFQKLRPGQSKERRAWVDQLFAWAIQRLEDPVEEIRHFLPLAPLGGSSEVNLAGMLPQAVPRSATDFGCHQQVLGPETPDGAWPVLSPAELTARSPALVAGCPDLQSMIVMEPLDPPSWRKLTDDWNGLPRCKANCGINAETLQRWKASAEAFKSLSNAKEKPALQFRTSHGGLTGLCAREAESALKDVLGDVESLMQTLQAQRDQDMKRAQAGVEAMMGWSQIPLDEAPDSTRQVWDLEVVSGFHPPMLSFEWIVASILAQDAGAVFASFLPSSLDPESCLEVLDPDCLKLSQAWAGIWYVGPCQRPTFALWRGLVKACLTVLLLATRATAARRALAHAFNLATKLSAAQLNGCSSSDWRNLQSMAARLAGELGSCEEFIESVEGRVSLDPHFLLFEWLFVKGNLRQGQLALVQRFVEAARSGQPLVRQLLMGEGKSAVIAPLLSLLLAQDLVLQVVPDQLLSQSLSTMRGLFGQAFFRPVYNFSFDRSEANYRSAYSLLQKLRMAVQQRAAVCTTASSVKSCLLSFVEVAQKGQKGPPGPDECLEAAQKQWPKLEASQNLEFLTLCLRGILLTFRQAVAVLDEIDLLLHPLMSELNFPVGPREPLDLSPDRWDLAMHLLQPFLDSSQAPKACCKAITDGLQQLALRSNPHLILAIEDFFFERLEDPLRDWLCEYFGCRPAFKSVSRSEIAEALATGAGPKGMEVAEARLLTLGHEWLKHTLPFVLSKVNRVHYGLLRQKDVADLTSRGFPPTGTRLQVAVPFTGLETPSLASEFANPDVAIGLTILAFGHEGMRQSDVKTMLLLLKAELLRDVATPPPQREAFRRFKEWTTEASEGAESPKLGDGASNVGSTVLPLDLVQPEAQTIRVLKRLWQRPDRKASVIFFYLRKEIFPKATPTQVKKYSACAQELASPKIFKVHLGFSGTPSNVLPWTMPAVEFDEATDGQTLAILASPQVVSLQWLRSGWTPRTLLDLIATRQPPFCALIDTGALLCGLENEEVAKLLMEGPLSQVKEACVFLTRADLPMILLKGASHAVPLEDANILPEKRFCYFDQPHTTGIDIQQPPLGVAAITLGRDMSFRELQQGAWRMRGLAKGQSCVMLLPEEVAVYMRSQLRDPSAVPTAEATALQDIQAALLVKSLELEELQARQLVRQDLASAWKDEALASLTDGLGDKEALLELVPTEVQQQSAKTLEASLRELAAPFEKSLSVSAAVERAVSRALRMLGKTTAFESATGEIVREQEEEHQHEHQIESEEQGAVNRPSLGQSRIWELQEKMRQLAAVPEASGAMPSAAEMQLLTFPPFLKVAELLGLASAGKALKAVHAAHAAHAAHAHAMAQSLRFSPNSRFTAEAPILRPVLVALELASKDVATTLALSLTEAETIRWALRHGGPAGIKFCLHAVSESPMFDADNTVMEHKVICSNYDTCALSPPPVCLLRFYLGESWFSQYELRFLAEVIGNRKQDFQRLRAAVFSARRPGGAADWSCTPLATVLGTAAAPLDVMLPSGPTFLERFSSEALAGGRDFVEIYVQQHAPKETIEILED